MNGSQSKDGFHIHRFAENRSLVLETLVAASWRHNQPCLFELDVTEARERIHKIRRETGRGISFLAWLMSCIGKACSEYPELHAWRHGSRNTVTFDDVDIGTYVERKVGGGISIPVPLVIRKVDKKTPEEISAEIRTAQMQNVDEEGRFLGSDNGADRIARITRRLPKFIRMLVWRKLMRDAFMAKRILGTVGVTSMGMVARGTAWPVPSGLRTLNFAVGPLARKPAIFKGSVVPREFVCLTAVFDHDIVDGLPAARFLARLAKLVEGAYGLVEL
jgi:pyruvate/2-oxoglutarate dehydrogenase complex dihydrolipoamide acyltransferase (E2) component